MRAAVMALSLLRCLVLVTVAAACATPYQRQGFSGGYTDNQIGPNTWSVTVNVNSYTSRGTALEYAHRRAGELCPEGYDIVDGTSGQSDFYVRTGNTVQNLPKAEVGLIVRCKTTPSRPAPPAPRVVVMGERPIFCTLQASNPGVGLCFLESDVCAAMYEKQVAGGLSYEPCEARTSASCFNATIVLDRRRETFCAPTISDCEAKMTVARQSPDFNVTQPQCGIYRVNMN